MLFLMSERKDRDYGDDANKHIVGSSGGVCAVYCYSSSKAGKSLQ